MYKKEQKDTFCIKKESGMAGRLRRKKGGNPRNSGESEERFRIGTNVAKVSRQEIYAEGPCV